MAHSLLSLIMLSAVVSGNTLSISGHQIGRELDIETGRLHTVAISNDLADRAVRVAGPEFIITIDNGEAVSSDTFGAVALKETERGVRATLVNAGIGLQADIDYSAASGRPWLYKQITFTNFGTEPVLLRTVEVEHLTVMDESVTYAVDSSFPSLGDWGQPVYTESLWIGMEFPGSRSSATPAGVIFLRQHPGVELKAGDTFITKRCVIGAAKDANVRDAFMDYVATLTPVPNPPRVNIYWNGFRVVKPPDRTPQGLKMVEYAKKLKDLTNFAFDGWSYDAGFDMYRPDALFVPNEPEIWDKTREALRGTNTPLGFWTSFSPIFDTPTHAWGKTQGFELQHDASYCLAGPVYFAAIKARLEEIVRTYGMNTINFDGMYWGQGFGCNAPGHGHLVGEGEEAGVYATERIVENKMAIFESLRRINPRIVLDLFVCNEWASPWWLMQLDGVHTVAGDTLGCDIPSPWLRDELITVRDIQVFDEHRRLRRQFPLWAEDLYGTQVRSDHLIDGVVVKGESMAARWEDEYVMALAGRGAVANHIICSDLGVLDASEGGLEFLGEVGNWVRRNALLYRNAQLLGGEPSKRQPYGYSHGDERGRSLVALRNPWIEPRDFELVLDDRLDLGLVTEPLYVTVVYPYRECLGQVEYGSSVFVPLRDYDVALLEVRTASRQFVNATEPARWVNAEAGGVRVCDTSNLRQLPSGRLLQEAGEGELRTSGTVEVPRQSAGAKLLLMLLPRRSDVQRVEAMLDGAPVEAVLHERTRGKGQDVWALIDVPSGNHEVSVAVTGRGTGQIGAWLRAEYELTPAVFSRMKAPEGDFFPVFAPESDRRLTTLLPVQDYSLPLSPLPEGDVAAIGDLRGRCLEATVGFFTVGWDTSCWPDDPVLRIGATAFDRGVGVHAPSTMLFDIDGAYKRFRSQVGLHGVPKERKQPGAKTGTCVFVVEGDGKKLYESPVLREGDAPLSVEVDVTGVKLLTLRTSDAGDSNYDDLAAWGDAILER
ncbi:MAG: NPCBM/NEW2 domain-containing protein [Candidatus Hydrogenedentes bacterium]|nr:NPCBM/NEW2 domain-containing protein [Candidatus Hydrogenedentota bacterium]